MGGKRRVHIVRMYAVVLALCVGAIAFGLWNGLTPGQRETLGLIAVAVGGLNMALLLRVELRKPSA